MLRTRHEGGADLADQAQLAEEMRRRTARPDTDPGGGFTDRSVSLDVTFARAGEPDGDLTPHARRRWGWGITLNPDGTVTATSPDGRRTLHKPRTPRHRRLNGNVCPSSRIELQQL